MSRILLEILTSLCSVSSFNVVCMTQVVTIFELFSVCNHTCIYIYIYIYTCIHESFFDYSCTNSRFYQEFIIYVKGEESVLCIL